MRYRLVVSAFALVLIGVSTSGAKQMNDSVKVFGAKGDGATLDTAAIQKAIDTVAEKGGGTVHFPAGRYLTGTIVLKDNVYLHLDHAATILGSPNVDDYPPTMSSYPSYTDRYCARALIRADGVENIGITGRGAVDGQGAKFRDNRPTVPELADLTRPYKEAGRHEPAERYADRPYIIRFVSCRNVLIEDIRLRNSPMWMQHYLNCEFLTVRGIDVYNHVGRNNDMIDIDSCRNVTISDCVGDTDDDALTLKSTGADPTEHVVITNCILRSHCNALKMGTESSGGFNDITISNCVIQQSAEREPLSGRAEGLAGIALEIVDGGTMERVAINNVVIEGTTAPIFIRLGNRARTPQPNLPKPPIGILRDVSISNVVATGAGVIGCSITGLPGHPVENVMLTNIAIEFKGGAETWLAIPDVPKVAEEYPECVMFGTLPAYGFFCRHADGLTLRDVRLRLAGPDLRPAIVCDDVKAFTANGLVADAEVAQVVLSRSPSAVVRGEAVMVETVSDAGN